MGARELAGASEPREPVGQCGVVPAMEPAGDREPESNCGAREPESEQEAREPGS